MATTSKTLRYDVPATVRINDQTRPGDGGRAQLQASVAPDVREATGLHSAELMMVHRADATMAAWPTGAAYRLVVQRRKRKPASAVLALELRCADVDFGRVRLQAVDTGDALREAFVVLYYHRDELMPAWPATREERESRAYYVYVTPA